MDGALDKKGFSARDVIYIVVIILGFSANYYTMDDRVGDLETSVSGLTEANKAYVGLPDDVETMKKDMKKYGALTETIYYGLLSEGIIKPPQ